VAHPLAIWARYNGNMTQRALDLLQKALSLSEEERADLACSLMESLDAAVDEGTEGAWNEEITRRVTELDSGKAKTVPWEEVRHRISSRLTHGK
jgi:putative addiction module component (TIGR02574 family)